MAEEKKSHARETAEQQRGVYDLGQAPQRTQNSSNRVSTNQTPDHEMSGSDDN